MHAQRGCALPVTQMMKAPLAHWALFPNVTSSTWVMLFSPRIMLRIICAGREVYHGNAFLPSFRCSDHCRNHRQRATRIATGLLRDSAFQDSLPCRETSAQALTFAFLGQWHLLFHLQYLRAAVMNTACLFRSHLNTFLCSVRRDELEILQHNIRSIWDVWRWKATGRRRTGNASLHKTMLKEL